MSTNRYGDIIRPTRIRNVIKARRIDPITVATQAADLARAQFNQTQAAQLGPPPEAATYAGYDVESEAHLVQVGERIESSRQALTTAGLSARQSVEFENQHLDSTPRVRRSESSDFITGESKPTWAVLLRQRRFLGTVSTVVPPTPPVWDAAVPATWFIAYSAGAFTPPGNDLPRYIRAGSDLLCSFGADDIYCTLGLDKWGYKDPPIVRQDGGIGGFRDSRCHLAGANNSIVIGGFAFSPDGFEATPSIPASFLPRVFVRIPGQPCGSGPQVEMNWRLIEITKLTEYVPPKIGIPALPGGVIRQSRFDTAYWIYSESGLELIATVPDFVLEDQQRQPAVAALLSIDGQNQISLDLKIQRFDDSQSPTTLEHYQIGQRPPTIPRATNWRRNWTNSTSTLPLNLPYVHPCQATFQQSPQANLNETDLRLHIANTVTLAALRSGTTHKTRLYNLSPLETTCRLSSDPDAEIETEIPPLVFNLRERETLAVEAIVLGGSQ